MNTCLCCGEEIKNKYCNVTCQNKHQNTIKAIKRFGNFKDFDVCCIICGKHFIVNEREKLHPQKIKYYCSRSCANQRCHSCETKEKISKSLFMYFENNTIKTLKNIPQCRTRVKQLVDVNCEFCGVLFKRKSRKQRFCGSLCSGKYARSHINCSKAGLASSIKQSENRRSKNEIYFAELCKNRFQKVLTNSAIFNGWDADVIIEDIKLAILWNGVWHYKKITKKHSVVQVQNRDRIKMLEIKNLGYEPYVIKDLGKYNKSFVEAEFINLIKYCELEKRSISPVS